MNHIEFLGRALPICKKLQIENHWEYLLIYPEEENRWRGPYDASLKRRILISEADKRDADTIALKILLYLGEEPSGDDLWYQVWCGCNDVESFYDSLIREVERLIADQ